MKPNPSRRTRRDFLKTAGAGLAAPYVITSSALGAQGRRPASERITTALIGSGGRGQQIIVGGDQVLAVCDVDKKHRDAAKAKIDKAAGNRDCAAYDDFREVLARDDLDAVVVATPDHWHVPIAIAAVKAGKAVYVEKPLTLTIQQGRILADMVRRYNAILQVGSQQRSDEKFIKAVELVRNGRLGELKTVKVTILARAGAASGPWSPQPVPPELDYDMWLGPAPWAPYHKERCHYNFRFVSDYSGGDMTNWGAHHLDIAQWGLGADDSGPVEAVAHGKRNPNGLHDAFYDVRAEYTYANGVKVRLESGTEDVKTGGVRFEGTKGWVYVSREQLDAEPKSLVTARIGPDEIHLAPESEAGTHMGIWLDCIRKRNPKGINVTAEIGHRSATVCHLANISMELGRPLKWDPAAEQFVDDDDANRLTWRPMRQPWQI
jgi:predicted dehydrogenase